MTKDLREYERDYLKRLEQEKEDSIPEEQRQAHEEQKKIDKELAEKMIKELSAKEYLILGALKNTDLQVLTKFHPVEIVQMYEKFFQCGLIEIMNRKLTWQEGVKVQNWLNSQEFKQYQNNVNKLLDWDEKQLIKKTYERLGLSEKEDVVDITARGNEELEKKRTELNEEWKNIIALYESKNKDQFHQIIEKNKSNMPLYLTMGLVNGSMMGIMMSKMDMNLDTYMQGMEFIYSEGYSQGFGDGSDGGSFDGGFEAGF